MTAQAAQAIDNAPDLNSTTHLYVGTGSCPQSLALRYANRHGLIAGATGTGKTISLQRMAEQFSRQGVPVFMADVKGDLGGISQEGGNNPKVDERLQKLGLAAEFEYRACPTICWDVFGKQGHPIRVTISEMGPILLSRLLELSEAQEGVLNIAFSLADDQGLLLLDIKDLRATLSFVEEHAEELNTEYGNISKATVGTIIRKLLQWEQQGAEQFFGEPALDISDLMRKTGDGRGYINLLAADELIRSPKLYATFLLWLLSELFETLPEVGDLDKPKLVFFFDEAHLLFEDAPKALLDQVEQVVRLIRSKGVGIYFITQNPQDVPDDVLGQLGNRIQHALRAFTPKDQKAVKVAAQTFRPNPAFDTEKAITELAVGEALVSTLQDGGTPSMVERTMICPPASRIGPISKAERDALISKSPVAGVYDTAEDRESAYEKLSQKAQSAKPQAVPAASARGGITLPPAPDNAEASAPAPRRGGYQRQTMGEAMAKSVVRSVGSTIGNQIARQVVRGILGAMLK